MLVTSQLLSCLLLLAFSLAAPVPAYDALPFRSATADQVRSLHDFHPRTTAKSSLPTWPETLEKSTSPASHYRRSPSASEQSEPLKPPNLDTVNEALSKLKVGKRKYRATRIAGLSIAYDALTKETDYLMQEYKSGRMTAQQVASAFDSFEQGMHWPKTLHNSPIKVFSLNGAAYGVANREIHAKTTKGYMEHYEKNVAGGLKTSGVKKKVDRGVAENALRGLKLYREPGEGFTAEMLAEHMKWFSEKVGK